MPYYLYKSNNDYGTSLREGAGAGVVVLGHIDGLACAEAGIIILAGTICLQYPISWQIYQNLTQGRQHAIRILSVGIMDL